MRCKKILSTFKYSVVSSVPVITTWLENFQMFWVVVAPYNWEASMLCIAEASYCQSKVRIHGGQWVLQRTLGRFLASGAEKYKTAAITCDWRQLRSPIGTRWHASKTLPPDRMKRWDRITKFKSKNRTLQREPRSCLSTFLNLTLWYSPSGTTPNIL